MTVIDYAGAVQNIEKMVRISMKFNNKFHFYLIFIFQTKNVDDMKSLIHKLEKIKLNFESTADVISQLHTNFVVDDQLK